MYSNILQPGRALGHTEHTPAPALYTATVMTLKNLLGKKTLTPMGTNLGCSELNFIFLLSGVPILGSV